MYCIVQPFWLKLAALSSLVLFCHVVDVVLKVFKLMPMATMAEWRAAASWRKRLDFNKEGFALFLELLKAPLHCAAAQMVRKLVGCLNVVSVVLIVLLASSSASCCSWCRWLPSALGLNFVVVLLLSRSIMVSGTLGTLWDVGCSIFLQA